MVRTRGLGHALSRVIGRGRQDEHDAVDVPQRRRPTALARRRRVHIMVDEGVPQVTEDVPHMAEDFPQVTEDVPHMANDVAQMSEDAPQMTVDVDGTVVEDLGRDGAEGSHVDEGFSGGPREPSVLISFAEHVAHAIWNGHECPELKLVSHGRKVALIGRPVPAIEGLVVATGLSPLIECSVVIGYPGLISAFVESGAFHSFEALSVDEALFLLMELLEVSGEEARAETVRARGAYSATNVHVVHLEDFRHLGQSGGYDWGAAALVHMYDQLDEASRTTTRQIGGYLTLLQCWIYEHFLSVHQCVTDDAYEETSPRASRWLMMKAHMKGITGASYRARCNVLTGQLRWSPTVVTVRPKRVLRQFGYIQSIPLLPVSASLSYDDINDRWMHFSDHVVAAGDLCVVLGQAGDQPRHAPAPDHEDYMQPDIPQVPVTFDPPQHVVVIAERLKRVLYLRMVTAGTELHDIIQDCLRIARGVPAQMEVLGLNKDGAQSIDDVFYVL
ncbi:Protein MAINTENANCE OF MERISTEMS [Glycine soja]